MYDFESVGCAFPPAENRRVAPGAHFLPNCLRIPSERIVQSVGQREVFEAALQFTRAEGILPAPESAHAIRAAIDQAIEAREKGEKRVILFNLSGHGLLDLAAYDQYLHNGMQNGSVSESQLANLAQRLPKVKLE